MFHYTKLDMFCNDVKRFADADGYVPEIGDINQDFSYPDKTFNDLKSWTSHIQQSVQATEHARQKLKAWRNRV